MSSDADDPDVSGSASSHMPQPFAAEYTDVAWRHLTGLKAFERRLVVDAVDAQLLHQPTIETRNRKRLRPNPLAVWELRIGDLRVLYDVLDADHKVLVVAIGKKEGNRLQIGGEEVEI